MRSLRGRRANYFAVGHIPTGERRLLSGLAGLTVASSAGLLLMGIGGNSCGSPASAAFAQAHTAKVAPKPVQDSNVAQTDQNAVDSAQSALDDAKTADDAAQARLDAATTAADNASTAAEDAQYSTDTSGVDTAQASVDELTSEVQTDQEMLSMDRQYGFDTSDDQQSLNSDTASLQQAQSDLAKAKNSAANAAGSVSSLQAAADRAAKKQSEAQAAADSADSDLTDAQDALDSAQQQQDQDEATFKASVAVWWQVTASERAANVAKSQNAADCRAYGRTHGYAALVGVAVALAIAGVVGLSTLRTRRFSRHRGGSGSVL